MEHGERLGGRTASSDVEPALGLVETASVALGYRVADAVAKASPVRLVWARTVSPGHFVVLVSGDPDEVAAAVDAGLRAGGDEVTDAIEIANVHRDLVDAVRGPRAVAVAEALGVVECRTVATTLLAADAAAKAAAVDLLEVRLAMHLGGKGFFLVAGETGDVDEAVATGAEVARARGQLVREVVIPRAARELLDHVEVRAEVRRP